VATFELVNTELAIVGGTTRSAISGAMTRIRRDALGRGPSRARTYALDSIVFCVLDDGLTPVELSLKRMGREDVVRRERTSLAAAIAGDVVREVEQITGATVLQYVSQIVFEPDMTVDILVLDRPLGFESAGPPEPDVGCSRAAIANGIAHLMCDQWGKGPTRARAHLEGDVAFCVLEAPLTRTEHTLLAAGDERSARELRVTLCDLATELFASVVQSASGRRVLSCAAQVTFDPEAVFLFFALEPDSQISSAAVLGARRFR
jgi:uncharacterized protein YbcI